MNTDTYVIGDVHGQYARLVRLLKDAKLADERLRWSCGQAALWFIGDYCDRGPDGIGVLDLIMNLQQQAREVEGRVGALLGNHEVVILAARCMGDAPTAGPGGNFHGHWLVNGGLELDLARLEDRHAEWLLSLPALARVGNWLFMHANSIGYLKYGSSIEHVNHELGGLLERKDPAEWDQLLGAMGRDFGPGKPGSREKIDLLLSTFGAKRLVHGHTPISGMTKEDPLQVTQALVYENGLCVNVDAGMYMGSSGFVYKLPNVG